MNLSYLCFRVKYEILWCSLLAPNAHIKWIMFQPIGASEVSGYWAIPTLSPVASGRVTKSTSIPHP